MATLAAVPVTAGAAAAAEPPAPAGSPGFAAQVREPTDPSDFTLRDFSATSDTSLRSHRDTDDSAALWDETVMGVLGGWILLVTLVVTIAGMPWAWWIMSVAGGVDTTLATSLA